MDGNREEARHEDDALSVNNTNYFSGAIEAEELCKTWFKAFARFPIASSDVLTSGSMDDAIDFTQLLTRSSWNWPNLATDSFKPLIAPEKSTGVSFAMAVLVELMKTSGSDKRSESLTLCDIAFA